MNASDCQRNLRNHRVLLTQRPTALPGTEHFSLDEQTVLEPGPGDVLLETLYVSVDPAMRVWMNEDPGYVAPIALGEVMRAGGVGRVLASRSSQFAVGDVVQGRLGWQTHPTLPADQLTSVDASLGSPLEWMGPLGGTGLTAYFGMYRVGAVQPGDRVLVSAASGGVGQIAASIARLEGCHTVGIAGGEAKCGYLTRSLGLTGAIDYKAVEDIGAALDEAFPDGIDVYFDNVGGPILDAVLERLRMKGRVVICGRISQTGSESLYGVRNLGSLIGKRARVEGFIVSDYATEFDAARAWLSARIKAGELSQRMHVLDGLEQAPEGLGMLFRGENTGKLVVQLGQVDVV